MSLSYTRWDYISRLVYFGGEKYTALWSFKWNRYSSSLPSSYEPAGGKSLYTQGTDKEVEVLVKF